MILRGVNRINDEKWHHVAGTFDGQELKLYLDGVLEAENPIANDVKIRTNTAPIRIGQTPNELANQAYRGSISEVRIWDRALTVEEIYANMHSHLAGDEEGLAGY